MGGDESTGSCCQERISQQKEGMAKCSVVYLWLDKTADTNRRGRFPFLSSDGLKAIKKACFGEEVHNPREITESDPKQDIAV